MLYIEIVNKGGLMTKQEYQEWFDSVDFIQKEMQFYSFPDFVSQANSYKRGFNLMTTLEKKLYQWYVFASSVNYQQKCMIWDFLNFRLRIGDLNHELRVHCKNANQNKKRKYK